MTLSEIYSLGKKLLKEAGVEQAEFDNMCIFEHCFGLKRHELSLYRNEEADEEKAELFLDCINQRGSGRPLQYILKKWEFCGKIFNVGEGVLVPRDDTEVLVNIAAKYLKGKKNAKVLDLCAGSGAISVVLADFFKDAEVVAVEVSEKAIVYLKENIKLNGIENMLMKKYDILEGIKNFPKDKFDIIISNPPYIKTDEIKTLQKEVQKEPKLALDGGKDGMTFYKMISKEWKSLLKEDGVICVEIGQHQEKDVTEIFKKSGLLVVEIAKDINKINRVIAATSALDCNNQALSRPQT